MYESLAIDRILTVSLLVKEKITTEKRVYSILVVP
jgi:hypothetical protein